MIRNCNLNNLKTLLRKERGLKQLLAAAQKSLGRPFSRRALKDLLNLP